jgi:hypothetical protein
MIVACHHSPSDTRSLRYYDGWRFVLIDAYYRDHRCQSTMTVTMVTMAIVADNLLMMATTVVTTVH